MAVLDDVPGIEVAVQINGRDVVEYDDPDASNHSSSKRTRHAEGFSKYDPETKNRYKYNCKFSPISTVDDTGPERVMEDSRVAKKLGLIEVEVHRSTHSGSREPGASSSVATPQSYVLAEKSLKGKAISHGVSYTLGRIIQAKSRPHVTFRNLEMDGGPIAVFRFHPSVSRSHVLCMTQFGEAEQLQQMEELTQWRQLIKSDRAGEESRPVKRDIGDVHNPPQDQAPTRPTKLSRLASGREAQVVDLTDD
ncbi:hypothetical protein DL768_009330 [Monosporascus sp. mg162]|nr:hypothetical protein DL768_009330 [Monosporascus sp. mg162]